MKPRLFSFRRCPYAMRARLALAASGIAYDTTEVSLKNKPPELIELSPKATVPVLMVAPNRVIDESLDIMFWALQQADPLGWLAISEPELGLALIRDNDIDFKFHLDRYKYPGRYADTPADVHRQQGLLFIERLNDLLSGTQAYLMGPQWSYVDMAIAPFVRQYAATNPEWFAQNSPLRVQQWLESFLHHELFLKIMEKKSV